MIYRLLHVLFLVICLQSLAIITANAQNKVYLPYHLADTNRLFELANTHYVSLQKAFVMPEGMHKKYRKEYLEFTEGFSKNIFHTVRHRALLDTVMDPFVQHVFKQLVEANPRLPKTRLVLIKSPVANAFALGDGTVLLNVGLLSKLENESQLAFVLSHELAHVYLQHMQKGLKDHLDAYYNQEFQKEVKKIVKQEYNMHAKLNSLVQNASINRMYHKRNHEKQADSLGYVMLSKTNFDLKQAHAALQLLDKIDEPYSQEAVDFQRHFGCPDAYHLFDDQPKKKTSIFAVVKEEDSQAKALNDTLKTHPDCQKRMLYLQALARETEVVGKELQTPKAQPNFTYIKKVSRYEVIQSWWDARHYDRAFFETLLLLQQEPGNEYLQAMAMLCLYQFRDHLQQHKYWEVVSRTSEHYPENLNKVLEKLLNLNLSDFNSMGSCLNSFYPDTGQEHEWGIAARYAYNSLHRNEAAAAELKKQYLQRYPNGRLKKHLFP